MYKCFFFVFISLASVVSPDVFGQAAILWEQKFEDQTWNEAWHVSAGTWQVGNPTSGPEMAYEGNQCAATILDGNYSESVDSRLIRHQAFVVPPASENPRLRFWHWYSFSRDDNGGVQIREVGNEEWQNLSENFINTGSNAWTYPFFDLSSYAGKLVEISFFFHSRNVVGSDDVSSGWYIDNVSVLTGPVVLNMLETWENGLGDWNPDKGAWEVGSPTSGPDAAFGGIQCAATVLSGNYAEGMDSRLRSPLFTIPVNAERPNLRFQHWYSFSRDDWGLVQIRESGNEEWTDLSQNYINTSGGVWSFPFIDLSEFRGKTVEIAFLFHSRNVVGSVDVSSGWYVDEISISDLTAPPAIESIPPPSFVTEANVWVTAEGELGILLPNPNTDGVNSRGELTLSYALGIEKDCFIEFNQEYIFQSWPQTIKIPSSELSVDNYLIRISRKATFSSSKSLKKDEIVSQPTYLAGPPLSDLLNEPPTILREFDRWFFHIPRDVGGFNSKLRIFNPNTQDQATVLFVGFNAQGETLFSEAKEVEPDTIASYSIYGLNNGPQIFGNNPELIDQISHIGIWESSNLTKTTIQYISKKTGYSVFIDELNLALGEQSGSEIMIEGATPAQSYFDGVAILNIKNELPTEVVIIRIDESGNETGEVSLGILEPGSKIVSVISDAFETFIPNGSYVVRSMNPEAPIQVLGLSGLKSGEFLSSAKVTVRR